MESTQKIEPVGWMVADETKAVMKALQTGETHEALFVGGCVRNTLLNAEVEDIDIATIWTPGEVIEKCEAAGIKTVPTGIDHGTVTAVIDKKHFEITTLRKDVETDGRHAVVAFSKDWAEDAARRDFTMNALFMDAQGHIYDPTGRGLDDLHQRHVVFVGDPAQRIAEDYLRILRFFRFYARFGRGEIDAKALAACKQAADKIETLSVERITQEFFKILLINNPGKILDLMFANGVLKIFKFPGYHGDELDYFCELQKRYHLRALAPRLYLLAGGDDDQIAVLKAHLLLPKVIQKDIELIHQVLESGPLANDKAAKVAIYKFGRVATAQALLIQVVEDHVVGDRHISDILRLVQDWEIPTFPITGEDLIAQGFEQGPALGQKLQEIEEWWIENGFAPDKDACLLKN